MVDWEETIYKKGKDIVLPRIVFIDYIFLNGNKNGALDFHCGCLMFNALNIGFKQIVVKAKL